MDDFFKQLSESNKKTDKKVDTPAKSKKTDNFFDDVASRRNEEQILREREKERERLRSEISTRLASRLEGMNLFGNTNAQEVKKVEEMIGYIIEDAKTNLPYTERYELIQDMVKEITSLGRIHHLMDNPEISEIMVNARDEVWIEKDGKLVRTDVKFRSEEEVLNLARKIAGHIGRRIDNSSPTVDARLPDGSRVHIIIPPLAMKGTTITIRKFKQEKLDIEDLIRFGSISRQGANFLVAAVKARANIIVSGGTGSGKTTTLNILSNAVPNDERIITIEDSAELQLYNDHVVRLESRPANAEGKGEYTIRMLIKDSLRMRPERVIVGEVRDGSAFDLMQACNTGHDGSMGTVHSNNPDACVARLDNLILQAGFELPSKAIRELIVEAVDLIVQIQRLKDGSRKITHITEVVKYDHEIGSVITKNIFEWSLTGIVDGKLQGAFQYTGYIPTQELIDKFERYGQNFFDLVKPEGE